MCFRLLKKMSMYGEPNLDIYLPDYYCGYAANNRRQGSSGVCKGILTHLTAMMIAASMCLGGYYYYHNMYLPTNKVNFSIKEDPNLVQRKENVEPTFQVIKPADFDTTDSPNVKCVNDDTNNQIKQLKEEISTIYSWRTSVNAQLSKLQWEQDVKINNALDNALETYDADGIGLMDYAASYAGGVICGISKETRPHPTHRPLSLFKIVNVDILSSPEELIRPCVLPGSCFVFRGDTGSVRIKLGKPISIGGVTLSHASRLLLGFEGMSSAPKEFEVYGFTNTASEPATFLGKFTYDWMGKQHQTFKVKKSLSNAQIFEDVELIILNNYGKEEFTCVYRFRVHKGDEESTEKSTQTNGVSGKRKTCC